MYFEKKKKKPCGLYANCPDRGELLENVVMPFCLLHLCVIHLEIMADTGVLFGRFACLRAGLCVVGHTSRSGNSNGLSGGIFRRVTWSLVPCLLTDYKKPLRTLVE